MAHMIYSQLSIQSTFWQNNWICCPFPLNQPASELFPIFFSWESIYSFQFTLKVYREPERAFHSSLFLLLNNMAHRLHSRWMSASSQCDLQIAWCGFQNHDVDVKLRLSQSVWMSPQRITFTHVHTDPRDTHSFGFVSVGYIFKLHTQQCFWKNLLELSLFRGK